MTATPSSEAPQSPATSVVLDTNAKVSISRRPVYLAIAAVVAFVAFTVVWFAVTAKDDYRPGPLANGFVASLKEHDLDVDMQDDELRCIDEKGTAVADDYFESESFDPLAETVGGEAEQAFGVVLLDECLERPSRIALLAGSMAEDGSIEPDQASCLAGKIDDFIVESGGYGLLADGSMDSASVASDLFGVMFGGMAECGIDLTEMMGERVAVTPVGAGSEDEG